MMRRNADFVKVKNGFETCLSSCFIPSRFCQLQYQKLGRCVNKTMGPEDVHAALLAITAADCSAAAFTSAHIFG